MLVLEESFRLLRLTLTGRVPEAAAFVVTSARTGDGTSVVATGLARAFAEAGDATLLVRTSAAAIVADELAGDADARGTMTALGRAIPTSAVPHLDVVTISQSHGTGPADLDVAAAMADARSRYHAIVIDTAPLPESSSAYAFVRAADGVLIAVRLGRSVVDADRDLMRLLAECGTETLGVVPTRGRAGRAFPRATTALAPADAENSQRIATRPIEVAP